MSQKPVTQRAAAEKVVNEIRRATRKQHSAEEKIRIVLSGLRGETALPSCAARRALPKACITAGRKNSSRLARSGWLVTLSARPTPAR